MGGVRKAYVMIITGQSNANSHGENLSAYFTIDPTKVHHYNSDDEAFVPYNSGVMIQNGYEVQAAGLQSELRGDSIIYVIRVAQGSLDISNWDSPSGMMWTLLEDAVTNGLSWLRANSFKPVVLSTLWVQGEQDAVVGTASATYEAKEQALIDNMRALDPVMENMQFISLKLTVGSGGGSYDPNGVTNVNTAKDNVAAANDNVIAVAPEDIPAPLSVDEVHFVSPDSYLAIGTYWSGLI